MIKMKKIKYKGKKWIEYKQPIFKSWMLSILIGSIWGATLQYVRGYWNIPYYIVLFFCIMIIQFMYENELKEAKEK